MVLERGCRRYDWPNQVWMTKWLIEETLSTLIGSRLVRFKLGLRGCRKIGRGLRVKGEIHLFTRRNDSIEIGEHVTMVSRFRSNPVGITNPCVLDTLMGGRIRIGNHVGLSGVILSSRSSIEIDDYTKLGANVRVFDHNYHSLNPETRRDAKLDRQDVRTSPVRIGKDVFIGTNAIILKGVAIGDRAIIAAGSVVMCNVPPDEIWGGNPAMCLKKGSR